MTKPKSVIYFSLVMATVGRYTEPENFIRSLLVSNSDLLKLELIIVDQNGNGRLQEIVDKYSDRLNIIYVPINQTGLAHARNMGLTYCSGGIIGFPDDDCEYFPETLSAIENVFNEYPETQVFIGRVQNYERQDVIRQWPRHIVPLSRWNFYTKFSSVGLFVRRSLAKEMHFCEQLGAGRVFGAAEDADYIYNLLKKAKALFVPNIAVYHPDSTEVSEQKLVSYGRGFGGFCRKNFDLRIAGLFAAILVYHFMRMWIFLCRLNGKAALNSWRCIKSRLEGFYLWPKEPTAAPRKSKE